ncbi:Elongator complex protein [Actinidia chinensis var. chinensis]|uniref:Elongator complex protein 5 n=1 Tax=Actinidia chinensis var. chinensis TaxID=1590841 RepID=A0A2R6RKN0_ACTCC|nr:Elongator complex protein [Actinidia chinensis var. chinensis]
MAELIRRALRDGALDGEHAPALTIKDSIDSPFGPHVFNHVLAQLSANILAGKSQSQGIVLVASSWSPSFYFDMLKSREKDVASFQKWFRVLDCYTDPLGWKERLMECGSITNQSPKASNAVRVCKDVRNLDNLFSSILQLGKELVGQGKGRFSVVIDSATEMIRHASISSLAALLSNIRSHDQVSCAFWLLHSDLHEIRVTSVLEYMSSMVASIEPMTRSASGQRGNYENLSLLERNSKTGKFHVRLKRRNGRVRLMSEDFCIEQSGIKFTPRSGDGETISQSLVPKVQFNLQLSEKERIERAKVVLPFEHQGIGKPIEIYDGRQSLNENIENSSTAEKLPTSQDPGKGEIIYFRDSDDEMPDSDEDPDDDLDI